MEPQKQVAVVRLFEVQGLVARPEGGKEGVWEVGVDIVGIEVLRWCLRSGK